MKLRVIDETDSTTFVLFDMDSTEEMVKVYARGLFTTVNIRGEVCFFFLSEIPIFS